MAFIYRIVTLGVDEECLILRDRKNKLMWHPVTENTTIEKVVKECSNIIKEVNE